MNSFIMAHKRKKSESSGGSGSLSDLVALGILTKPIAEFSNSDVGTTVFIPYNDTTGKFSLNEGRIEFEVVGVNHHKDTNNADTPTITLMTKNIIRLAAFDDKEPDNPLISSEGARKNHGNNRWSVSNIRQWLNSPAAAGSWFNAEKTHAYDATPDTGNVSYNADGAYADAPGFLTGFSDDVLQHFTDITNITALCMFDDGGSETTVDKVFLPSYTEMFGVTNNGIAEGKHLYKFANGGSTLKNGGEHGWYWMRSPLYYYSDTTLTVNDKEDASDTFANNGNMRYRANYSSSLIVK